MNNIDTIYDMPDDWGVVETGRTKYGTYVLFGKLSHKQRLFRWLRKLKRWRC